MGGCVFTSQPHTAPVYCVTFVKILFITHIHSTRKNFHQLFYVCKGH